MITRRPVALAIVFLLLLATAAGAAPVRPRLVVLISIDQFRADYLTRFWDLYKPATDASGAGGFRYLMEQGAYYTDAQHDHYPLYTGPGHSIHFTGAPPYKTGIVGNDWFDRDLNRERYCVEDPSSDGTLVGTTAKKTGISPSTLRVSTVGDELKMATGGQGKVWAVAFKDRAAVLMAGRLADGVLWFDDETGNWITSKFYRKDGKLPAWVSDWNDAKKLDAKFDGGKLTWTLSVAQSEVDQRVWAPKNDSVNPRYGLGKVFPHPINGGLTKPGKDFYNAFTNSPFGNEYVLEMAREILTQEKLGQDELPDILAINLSSNDYVGHAFGPDSAEVLDISVQTDGQLSAFFQFLAANVPGGLDNVTIVVTADHRVAPIAGEMKKAGFPAGAITLDKATVQKALQTKYGAGDWVEDVVEANVYLNAKAFNYKGIDFAQAEAAAAEILRKEPGIYAAYTRSQILDGRLPDTAIGRRVARSFHPKVSGDVVLVSDPYWVPGQLTGTTHGTPYAYDTSVPLLLGGAGIKPGRYTQRVSTLDIAPTLSDLLGILQPSGCEGHVLSQALK